MNLKIDNCYEDGNGKLWHCDGYTEYLVGQKSFQLMSIDSKHVYARLFHADGKVQYSHPDPKNLVREYLVYMDGNAWAATNPDFDNLQESPAGFGDTQAEAIKDLKAYEEAHCE